MTRKEILRDKKYIENHIGEIPVRRMMTLYNKYLNGSDEYIFGMEYNGEIFALRRKHIPLKYCSCQTDHKTNNQYLRIRNHIETSKEVANSRGVINLGNAEEVYKLYTCGTKSGHNGGYCFEIALFNYYEVDGWKQDNKRADKGGDIEINGVQIQAKFCPKESLATITTTKKLLNKINELLNERVAQTLLFWYNFGRPALSALK